MALNHYVLTHRHLIRIQKKGNLICPICHQPIREGQHVATRKCTAIRHEECYQRSFL